MSATADNKTTLPEWVKSLALALVVPVLVGVGSASITTQVVLGKQDERIKRMESRVTKNEDLLEYLRRRTEDQERQLAKLESLQNVIQDLRSDVKALLKSGGGR